MLRGLLALALLATACVPDDRRVPAEGGAPGSARAPARVLPRAGGAADPLLSGPFEDRFERAELGPDWAPRSGVWRISGGRLCGEGAKNQPVWLKRRLPVNARIEFSATSASPEGDIKAEFWGDGRSGATGVSYTNATSYLTIFGGWKNSFHVLARIDEHAPNRPELRLEPGTSDPRLAPVKAGQTYRFHVERTDGRTVKWKVDGMEILSYADPAPLAGDGHEHFGFNNWATPVCFDDLVVTPLGAP